MQQPLALSRYSAVDTHFTILTQIDNVFICNCSSGGKHSSFLASMRQIEKDTVYARAPSWSSSML